MATVEEKRAIATLARGIKDPVVVELGAHRGEDALWIGPLFEEPLYVMVEPDNENVKFISRRDWELYQTRETRLIHAAIADFTGNTSFYGSTDISGVRGSGSINPPTGHLKHFPQISFPSSLQQMVPVYTLDDLYKQQKLLRVDLLWVDIQGAEGRMILGGSLALSRTRYLFIEAEEIEFYEGQILRPELLRMLRGWEVLKEFECNLLLHNTAFSE